MGDSSSVHRHLLDCCKDGPNRIPRSGLGNLGGSFILHRDVCIFKMKKIVKEYDEYVNKLDSNLKKMINDFFQEKMKDNRNLSKEKYGQRRKEN